MMKHISRLHSVFIYDILSVRKCIMCVLCLNFLGLGDEWGAAPPPNNPLESAIKELGSHLLQVSNCPSTSFLYSR